MRAAALIDGAGTILRIPPLLKLCRLPFGSAAKTMP